MAFVFNTSFYVVDLYQKKWEQWLHFEMIPAVGKTIPGLAVEIFEMVSVHSGNSRVFSVQWRCSDVAQTENLDSCIAELLAGLTSQFGEKVTHFSSIMKKLS